MPFNIAEVELLKKDESPLYNPSIPYHLEKTVSVKSEKARTSVFRPRQTSPCIT